MRVADGLGGAPTGGELSGMTTSAGVGRDPVCPCPGSTASNMKVMTRRAGIQGPKGGKYNKRFCFVLCH